MEEGVLTGGWRWEFVQEYDVQLPDEYDQIYEDLERFWGLEPTEPHKT